jgi:pimeloyl-ACP methyl ester carboxylesterase
VTHATTATPIEGVVLLHGIARSSASLSKMERALQHAGFKTLNLDYPSRTHPLETLAEIIHAPIERFLASGIGTLHFVTHSMGGLVARAYLTRYRPVQLGRVVMLGTPNQGCEIADRLARFALYRRFFGPAGGQLGTHRDAALHALLGVIDYPVGIIAGDRTLYPISWLLIPGPNDGRVSVARSTVAGMTAHLTVHATHSFMIRNATVIRQSIAFLKDGHFLPTHAPFSLRRPS